MFSPRPSYIAKKVREKAGIPNSDGSQAETDLCVTPKQLLSAYACTRQVAVATTAKTMCGTSSA
ncbi:hypothetical protein [Amycolatopsis australiensis]|uniref:Uncharacterized protein n=1 Tax=Amycolatopsis australiensis TaxID=546364 RepID=A0A1K1T8U9_9PSEU|nr:hypothetical protein [Amycolatopsis australiensis]SFW92469.1 hypothetical protein SAMN04489730_8650 [Amycolatopsis australiensis]